MRNPRVSALVSVVVILISGWQLLSPGDEAPSTAVVVLEWLILAGAALGLVGSLMQMSKH